MDAGRSRPDRTLGVVALAVALLGAGPAWAAGPPPAWTGTGRPHVMRPMGSVPEARPGVAAAAATNGSGPLAYGSGPVQERPTVYLDFWGSRWTDGTRDAGGFTGAAAQSYIQAFVRDLAGSPWFDTQTQYCQGAAAGATTCGAGTTHVGQPSPTVLTWNDAATTPAPTDAGIAAEAERARFHFGLVADVDATVIVLTPTGQSSFQTDGGQLFCGYHSYTTDVVYSYIPWMPDAGAACGRNLVNPADDAFGHGHFDGFSIVVGHEVVEAATDPLPFAILVPAGQPTFGWLDSTGLESADKCEHLAGWPSTSVAFGAGAGNLFAVQPLWSNSTSSCPTENLAGLTAGHAAISSWGAGDRDVFVRGSDGAMHTRHWDGTGWSGWQSLGGGFKSAPAAVSWGVGRIDVFGVGLDGALWHSWASGGGSGTLLWAGWHSLGGGIVFGPAASSWAPGGLDIAAVGLDRSMWHLRWNGSAWLPWQWLGGSFTSDPAVISWRDGSDRVDIFGRGLDGGLWQDAWIGGWTGWQPRGGFFAGGPALASTGPFRMQVYGVGGDGALWHQTWNGSAWSAWSSLGGAWPQNPSAASAPGSNAVDLAMIGSAQNTERFVAGPS